MTNVIYYYTLISGLIGSNDYVKKITLFLRTWVKCHIYLERRVLCLVRIFDWLKYLFDSKELLRGKSEYNFIIITTNCNKIQIQAVIRFGLQDFISSFFRLVMNSLCFTNGSTVCTPRAVFSLLNSVWQTHRSSFVRWLTNGCSVTAASPRWWSRPRLLRLRACPLLVRCQATKILTTNDDRRVTASEIISLQRMANQSWVLLLIAHFHDHACWMPMILLWSCSGLFTRRHWTVFDVKSYKIFVHKSPIFLFLPSNSQMVWLFCGVAFSLAVAPHMS